MMLMLVIESCLSCCQPVILALLQCEARHPEERDELLAKFPLAGGGSIQKKRIEYRSRGWMPFVKSVFSSRLCKFLMGPFTIHQRLVRDELHLVCTSCGCKVHVCFLVYYYFVITSSCAFRSAQGGASQIRLALALPSHLCRVR